MLALGELQKREVRIAWTTRNPHAIAKVAFDRLFAEEFVDQLVLEHKDQVSKALYTGVLAGEMLAKGMPVEEFITRFEKEVLNGGAYC